VSSHCKFYFILVFLFSGLGTPVYGVDIALVLRSESKAFEQVVNGLTDDLKGDLQFSEHVVDRGTDASDIQSLVDEVSPNVVVLVGNRSINAYIQYQQVNKGEDFPPAIVLAALYVDQLAVKIDNVTGIRYEIPAVTSAIHLRSLLKHDVKKIGVVYRAWMKDFIEENVQYCKREGFDLIGYEIGGKSKRYSSKIKKGIAHLIDEGVDALWVINDNALLNSESLVKGWIPGLKNINKPVIVSVKSIILSKFKFGSFAVVLDHYDLGVQGASIIAEIMDNNWSVEGREIEQPLSVRKMVNLAIFKKKGIEFNVKKLSEMDEVIWD